MSGLVVLAEVAGRTVAIAATDARSVVDLDDIVPVPRAPACVAGIAALRSRALTVIDTGLAMGGEPMVPGLARAIVIEEGGHAYALAVDRVSDVVATIAPPTPVPGKMDGRWQRVALGVVETAQGPAVLVDPAAILALVLDEAA